MYRDPGLVYTNVFIVGVYLYLALYYCAEYVGL
jgi:hypothetical protein